jgi:hypothetical protein
VLQFPPKSRDVDNLINSIRELVSVTAGNEADNRRIPELGTSGVESGNEVNSADEEDTLNRTGEGG